MWLDYCFRFRLLLQLESVSWLSSPPNQEVFSNKHHSTRKVKELWVFLVGIEAILIFSDRVVAVHVSRVTTRAVYDALSILHELYPSYASVYKELGSFTVFELITLCTEMVRGFLTINVFPIVWCLTPSACFFVLCVFFPLRHPELYHLSLSLCRLWPSTSKRSCTSCPWPSRYSTVQHKVAGQRLWPSK